MAGFPQYGFNPPTQHNFAIAGWFTLISLVRSYLIRRWFNRIMLKVRGN
jgi:hypothetical protein